MLNFVTSSNINAINFNKFIGFLIYKKERK